jgi:hypothetical protein
LVSVFGGDLNPGEDGWVRSTRTVVKEKIADDEAKRNGNHDYPYLRYRARWNSKMPQLFRYETCFADRESRTTRLGPSHSTSQYSVGIIFWMVALSKYQDGEGGVTTSIVPLLCLALMVYAVVHSRRKLRTVLYGVLAIAGTLGVVFALVKVLSLNEAIMGHVAAVLVFVIPAYVTWTHARSTQKTVSA